MAREMKDSGVEWIGEIPKEWEVVKLKKIAKIQTGNTPSKVIDDVKYYCNKDENDGFLWVKPNDLNGFKFITDSTEKLTKEGKEVARIAPENSILVCCIGSIGKFGIINSEVAFNQQINCVTFSSEIFFKYGVYLIASSESQHWLYSNGNVVKILNNEGQGKIIYPIPPLEEQEKIANYLDKKVSDIDLIIEKTKATIEEYKKYKQSIITEAVTKGINPNVEMKDSGNIYIGKIPKKWQMKKIKYLFLIKKDIAGKIGFDILSITQKGIKIKDTTTNEGQMSMDYSKYQLLNVGEFAMNHMDLLTGWVDISKYDGVTSPDYRVFKLIDEKNNSKNYYLYFMQICYSNKIFYGLGQGVSSLGRWRLQSDKFMNFIIPVPPLEEQNQIVEYLDKKTSEIDTLITKKEALIAELEEYKKSLIYECVTGKKEIK